MNKILLKKACNMLFNIKLRKKFWDETIFTSCYLMNRSPSTAIECKMPMEVWSDTPIDYSSLKVFGYLDYAHVNEGKLKSKAKKCFFLGYAFRVKKIEVMVS